MTFAQALARIEEALVDTEYLDYYYIGELLSPHADSIVQLGKVAETFRYAREGSKTEQEACEAYDKLMKEE